MRCCRDVDPVAGGGGAASWGKERKETEGSRRVRVTSLLNRTDGSDRSGSGRDSIHFPEAKISPKIQGVVES